jgi:DNA-binding CsgD family transcriptional regulator
MHMREDSGPRGLTSRELQVLLLIAEEKTDREIARALGIGERTIRAHVSRIILKLGVVSRVGAAVAVTTWKLRAELDPTVHGEGDTR